MRMKFSGILVQDAGETRPKLGVTQKAAAFCTSYMGRKGP